jgi:hypothetical protein
LKVARDLSENQRLSKLSSAEVRAIVKATEKKTQIAVEEKLQSCIEKFEPKRQALIRALRRSLRKRMPAANELVYDNYNFFVIGYCSTERPSDCVLSIAADANRVSLSFYRGATVPDPHKLLVGSGTQNRFLHLESASILGKPEVEALISAAIAQNTAPFATSGRGKLIIRAVSRKQRPRRKAGQVIKK